jgi:hypothetical protein
VPFVIHNPKGDRVSPAFFGLADSGADGSIFPMPVMKDLGIDTSECEERDQIGSGGPSKFYCWKGGTLPADVYGVTVDLMVQFSNTPFILLGRSDFFAAFKVSFDQRRLSFTIESY